MSKSEGWFWLKFSRAAALQGGAAGGANSASIGATGTGAGTAGAGGGKFIEGYTIRPTVAYGMQQVVATLTFLPATGEADGMPCAFCPDMTDQKKAPRSFSTEKAAMEEKGKKEFTDWAADGVLVLVSLGVFQAAPDEM